MPAVELSFSSLKELSRAVQGCTRCPLHKEKRNPVVGEGPEDAEVMLIGEAPGRKEDETGRPFVGPAGKLLDSLLEKAGLNRGDVYITNIVKCRPPGNRDPTEEEKRTCSPHLLSQISLINPKVVITLGRHSSEFLFSYFNLPWKGISRQHGKPVKVDTLFYHFILVPMYHPASALYRRNLLPEIEEDWKALRNLLRSGRRSPSSVL